MKKTIIFKGCLLVSMLGLVLASCASGSNITIIDQNIPLESSSIIHMNEDYSIVSIDGHSIGRVKGIGANRYAFIGGLGEGIISSPMIQIPAGQHTIVGRHSSAEVDRTATFDFVAGRHYEMIIVIDSSQVIVGAAVGGGFDFIFQDITDYLEEGVVPEEVRREIFASVNEP